MSRKNKNKNKNANQEEAVAPVLSAPAPEEVTVPAEEPVVAPATVEELVAVETPAEEVKEEVVVETIAPKAEKVEEPKAPEIDNVINEKIDPPKPKTKFVLERKGYGCRMFLMKVDTDGKTQYTENSDAAMFETDKKIAHMRFNSLVDGLKAKGTVKKDAVFEIVAV